MNQKKNPNKKLKQRKKAVNFHMKWFLSCYPRGIKASREWSENDVTTLHLMLRYHALMSQFETDEKFHPPFIFNVHHRTEKILRKRKRRENLFQRKFNDGKKSLKMWKSQEYRKMKLFSKVENLKTNSIFKKVSSIKLEQGLAWTEKNLQIISVHASHLTQF